MDLRFGGVLDTELDANLVGCCIGFNGYAETERDGALPANDLRIGNHFVYCVFSMPPRSSKRTVCAGT